MKIRVLENKLNKTIRHEFVATVYTEYSNLNENYKKFAQKSFFVEFIYNI